MTNAVGRGVDTVFAWLTGPFLQPFMLRGLVASLVVGVICSVVGCYVVLRGMAFLGDALAQKRHPA